MKTRQQMDKMAKKLFKNNYITKVDLEKFLAEEQAFEKLYNYNLERIEKNLEIELKHLDSYKKYLEHSKNFLYKLKNLSKNKKSIILNDSINLILKDIDMITQQILQNFNKYISVEIKKKIESRY